MGAAVVVGAKGSPGATTSTVALATGWPGAVLVADADLAGGDVAPGWLGGRVGMDRGLVTFAAASRHLDVSSAGELAAELAAHVVGVPEAPAVLVLAGLAHAGQAGGVDGRVWARLAAATGVPWPGLGRVDLLADCGRVGDQTPWPLVAAAGVVLVTTRPTLRGVHHARHALAAVRAGVADMSRVGLLVCGPGPYEPGEVGRALGVAVRVVLPADAKAAAVLSDGGAERVWSGSALARSARAAARVVGRALTDPAPAPVPAGGGGWR